MKTLEKLQLFRQACRSYAQRPGGFARHTPPKPEQYGLTTPAERHVAEQVREEVNERRPNLPNQ